MKKLSVRTEGGTVIYWRSDAWDQSRTALFFLHGMTADHRLFQRQYPYFEKYCNILTWDAPAHGESRPFAGFSYEKAALAVRDILDAEKVSSAIFVGQSMGGFITQSVIKRFPERVRGFVSIDSTPFGEDYYSKSDRWWLRQIEWMSRLYPFEMMKKALAKQVAVSRDARRNMTEMLAGYDKRELCHLMGVGFAGFLEDNCDLKIRCPVLLILGERDRTGKVRAYNRMWAERTGFPLTVVPGAAHNANDDQPDIVNEEIAGFIASLA